MGTFVIALIVTIVGGILPGLKCKFDSYNAWSALANLIVVGLIVSIWGASFNVMWVITLVLAVINMIIGMTKDDESGEFTHGTFYTICLFALSALVFFSDVKIIISLT